MSRPKLPRSPSDPNPPGDNQTSIDGTGQPAPEADGLSSESVSTPTALPEDPADDLDLSNIPQEYLEAYPYPAFVVVAAHASRRDPAEPSFPRRYPLQHTPPAIVPYAPVAGNRLWKRLSRGRRVLDCLSGKDGRLFGEWVTGRYRGNGRSKPGTADLTNPSAHTHTDKDVTGESGPAASEQTTSEADTIVVEFTFSGGHAKYELVKALLPIYNSQGPSKSVSWTRTFVVVTAIPRSRMVPTTQAPSRHTQDVLGGDNGPRLSTGGTLSADHMSIPSSGSRQSSSRSRDSRKPTTVLDSSQPRGDRLHLGAPKPIPDVDLGAIQRALGHEGAELIPGQAIYFHRDGTYDGVMSRLMEMASSRTSNVPVMDLLDTTDWVNTPLGPREQWSETLKAMVSFVMMCPMTVVLWWGDESTMLYNKAYADALPTHPEAFAQSGAVARAELIASLGPLAEVVMSGIPIYKESDTVVWEYPGVAGDGTLMNIERYCSEMWVPFDGDNGEHGVFNFSIDTTERVIAERRTAMLRDLAEGASTVRTVDDFDRIVLETVDTYPKDIPFAMIYHVEKPSALPKAPTTRREPLRVRLNLAGTVGVPEHHPSAPQQVVVSLTDPPDVMIAEAFPHLASQVPSPTKSIRSDASRPSDRPPSVEVVDNDDSQAIDHWPFAEAIQRCRPILVEDCSTLVNGYEPRVWDALPNKAIVLPIVRNIEEDTPTTILVIGLSPRVLFDDNQEAFIQALRIQMAASLISAQAYQADQLRLQELASLDRAKSLLFSNISRELFTPLTLITGPIDDVMADLKDGHVRDTLTLARRNLRRLTRLVTMLMDESNVEAGLNQNTFKLINLGVVTRNIAALFGKAAQVAHLEYIVHCDTEPRDTYVDRDQWEKILFNLIGNAIKYTMSGFVRVRLTYTLTEAVLEVQDSGVGIPASDLAVIRGFFLEGKEHTTNVNEVTGLSMSITKRLVERHKGRFDIESKTANESAHGTHGTICCVRIPIGSSHFPPEAIDTTDKTPSSPPTLSWHPELDGMDEEKSDRSSRSSNAERVPPRRGIDPSTLYFSRDDVIMIVDDSPDSRLYMRSIFEPYCKVIEARDGQQALEMCNSTLPDLIVADQVLPRLSGPGLLQALRSGSDDQRLIPFLMLTSADSGRTTSALAADDFLARPFNARELVARAHMQLQLGKRRRALEQLFIEQTMELRVLTEQSPVAIFRCSPDGYVSYANTAWYKLSGYPMDEPVTNWGDYVCDDEKVRISGVWEGFIQSGRAAVEDEWQWTNGRSVSTKVLRLDAVGNGLPGFVGCCVDITERRLNEQLQRQRVEDAEQRRAEAEEARHQQELLIDITSHEIRNPISSLMQCAMLVKSNLIVLQEQLKQALEGVKQFWPTKQLIATMAEDLEALDSIYQCGLTQERISNDVLSLGKLQLNLLQMFDVETNIIKEAEKLTSVFQNEARMKRIELSLNVGSGFEELNVRTLMTDPVRLGQVSTNLLSNAIRFTANSPERRIVLSIDVGLDPPPEGTCKKPDSLSTKQPLTLTADTPVYLFISVSDTGPGLTESELEMLFQRFSQASAKTHTVFGGSGLGLFVCRKIAELMGGRIEVVSEYGKGSDFRFFIQALPCPTPTLLARESVHNPILANRAVKPRILVVEDNLINQTVLIRQLKHVGLEVDSANNGQEALEKIRVAMAIDRDGMFGNFSLSPAMGDLRLEDEPDGGATPTPSVNPAGSRRHGVDNTNTIPSPTVPTTTLPLPLTRSLPHTPLSETVPGRPYDCVLMDLEMPVMDGYIATRKVREDEAAGRLHVSGIIALTGNARQAMIDSAMADFTDVVVKPYRLDDVLRKIELSMRNGGRRRGSLAELADGDAAADGESGK